MPVWALAGLWGLLAASSLLFGAALAFLSDRSCDRYQYAYERRLRSFGSHEKWAVIGGRS
jgi:hypothetical protein